MPRFLYKDSTPSALNKQIYFHSRSLRQLMSQAQFLDTNFIENFLLFLHHKKYLPMPNESNIKLRIIKPQQALNIDTKY